MDFVVITLNIGGVKLKLFRCFRAIRISIIISLLINLPSLKMIDCSQPSIFSYSIVERADRIARELDVSAKGKT